MPLDQRRRSQNADGDLRPQRMEWTALRDFRAEIAIVLPHRLVLLHSLATKG
jgi:hypothetical protein